MQYRAAKRVFQELEAVEVSADAALPSLPGYHLDRRLGSGAGGEVFRGFREGSDRPLAIKILRVRLGEAGRASASSRAWRELDLLTQTRPPALPRVIDHGLHEGRLFIATEFVEGEALDAYCEANRLPLRERVGLLVRVAEAVQSLHERGVIHRDIKPSNVLIDGHGHPVIIDLGIASLLTDDVIETLTADGAPIGSPAFMSPEQARGTRPEISTRSDVYSLGATAFVVLTGHTPHAMAETIHESVRRVAQDPPRDARELDASLPRDLAAVLGKAVERDSGRRYESAAGLARDLQRWLDGETVEATRAGAWPRFSTWAGHHRGAVIALASLFLGAVLGIGALSARAEWIIKPSRLSVSHDGRTARFQSRIGLTLHEWTDQGSDGLRFADTIAGADGVPIALIGFDRSADPAWSGRIVAFRSADPSFPYWATPRDTEEYQPPVSVLLPVDPARDFGLTVRCAAVADALPWHDGEEIVVSLYETARALSVLRVYSADGEALAEQWVKAEISGVSVDLNGGAIICTGRSRTGAYSIRQGRQAADRRPRVVFALRLPGTGGPAAGFVADPWLTRPRDIVPWCLVVPDPPGQGESGWHAATIDPLGVMTYRFTGGDATPGDQITREVILDRDDLIRAGPEMRSPGDPLPTWVISLAQSFRSPTKRPSAVYHASLASLQGLEPTNPRRMISMSRHLIKLAVLSGLGLTTSVAQAADINDGLVAYFPFEGMPFDASNRCYSVTVNGDPTYGPGAVGRAMVFDGVDDAIYVDHLGELSFDLDTDSFSIAFYVYYEGDDTWSGIMQDRWGGNLPVSYNIAFLPDPDDKVGFHGWYGGGTGYQLYASKSLFRGRWAHAAMTFDADAGLFSLYVNGELVDQDTRPAGEYDDPDNRRITIGAQWVSSGQVQNWLAGKLDELRIYHRVLTEEEIDELVSLSPCAADFNEDGDVNTLDVLSFLNAWAAGCP